MEEKFEEKKSFNGLFIESVDEVLTAIGNSIKIVLYLQLKNSYGISKDQIPDRVEDFMNALQSTLGVGARHIELQVIRQIQSKTGITCPVPIQNGKFIECVVFVKQEYEKGKF
ncbi:MAG: hypothetical protein M1540_04675 [Candidatus Bathyarchaeota archaeon]|nr:hypothetical protein [Candidatus Bathyarchaeota archaeon]